MGIREGTTVTLSWSPPTGEFDSMAIRQCVLGTDLCTEHAVSTNSLELTVQSGVEYEFTLLLYEGEEVVYESTTFRTNADERGRFATCCE